ncbi:MAG: 16S rRNA (uracil(1498)-N(3))-methyltransferase [Dehalococcoidia bacterium]|nr:MAG: 16S rRNA (uracil(1498)-N(3))-methyltransferase [Dehalococcoidia bacterium]
MHRFFLPEDCINGQNVAIPGSLVHRLRRVLRLNAGDRILVLDNSGWEYEVELVSKDRGKLEGVVTNKALAEREPGTDITLYQALLKGHSFDLVLQKCTEIGVMGFVPMICERCVPGKPTDNKLDRWRSIILEAAQQSRRGRLPVLHDIMSFDKACKTVAGAAILPWEGESAQSIGSVLKDLPKTKGVHGISIFIGPEGGFSARELELARDCGITPISLGRRILRAETAGLVSIAVALYELGDLGDGS